ncbi:MAG: response regulator [Deltaproteobacteria bacterium]|jgi:putative two-component system response regulator|nr:response regulator [Deltaproteobacteria bacterium]
MADQPPLIMLVDDNRTNLMAGKVSLSDDYTVLTVSSARKMFDLMERQKPEVILLDVMMPEMGGFEALRILKERPDTRDIPVIFLTGLLDTEKEMEGIGLGAVDYIMKPFSPPLLRQRIALHIELVRLRRLAAAAAPAVPEAPAAAPAPEGEPPHTEEAVRALLRLQRAVISALAGRYNGRQPEAAEAAAAAAEAAASKRGTGFVLFEAAARSGRWPEETERWDQRLLGPASLLHDVGKLYVRDEVIHKPGRLSPAEYAEARLHVELGLTFIGMLPGSEGAGDYLRYARILAGYHHERWDGQGYPHGLRGEDIPLMGRIMAVADVYDALTCFRPYRGALEPGEAARIVQEGAGTAFDPAVVEVFRDSFP